MNVIYSTFYQLMNKHGTDQTFASFCEQFDLAPRFAELNEQAWWELQIRATSLGQYAKLVHSFAGFYTNIDKTPYLSDPLADNFCLDILDWLTFVAKSTTPELSRWIKSSQKVVQNKVDIPNHKSQNESKTEQNDFYYEQVIMELADIDFDQWNFWHDKAILGKLHGNDPQGIRTIQLPEVPLIHLEETIQQLNKLVTTEETPTKDKALDMLDFEEALAWFDHSEDSDHLIPAVADDFASAKIAFQRKNAADFYEPIDKALLDNIPPEDPDMAFAWLQSLSFIGNKPIGTNDRDRGEPLSR